MLEIFAPADGAARAVDVPEGTSGLRHLTFLFENIDETFAKLEKAGVELKERPRLAVNREVLHKVAFVRDPDGILIELAERLPLKLLLAITPSVQARADTGCVFQ